jgi:hypothetical protein
MGSVAIVILESTQRAIVSSRIAISKTGNSVKSLTSHNEEQS